MHKYLICLALLAASPLMAQEASSAESTAAEATDGLFPSERPDSIDALKWEKRVLLVFADSPNDPNFRRQIEALREDPGPMIDRDIVVFTDTVPEDATPLRETFRPRGFMLVLVGKDGQIKLRKPFPWDVREISRSIDKTELRQQEIRDQQGNASRGTTPN
ncbi:hypothetical protein OB2597_15310 [Pseudooceanicola batsensis HTCC2597]|uniref:DUF4174 domain-containing protein n=1 Tax=Pseudooceanicola batsensis (strain ATCC BAA-863 / DSM 15984 / KCTC 12145 / HTCC2597) TaxID=252305 RepID=A3TYU4_PSEBH|nr:DUF4174 domain-containing protein [Pseudooceanicola batsensis]EAQ02762.1 hypothetical protein OB2597_15310 [Pseudooceanicola batsensis HTCC2597]